MQRHLLQPSVFIDLSGFFRLQTASSGYCRYWCQITKGLRHTVATTLREAGLDERRIADLLGQKTLSMARHYSRSANLAAKNRETMATLESENARRNAGGARIVKPSAKSVKPKPKEESE